MAVITLGSQTSPTVIGSDPTVTTGTTITTLPVSSPVTIMSDGAHSDSYWALSGAKVVPDTISHKVGLGTVDTDTVTDNHFMLYDSVANEIKKIAASEIELKADTRAWSTITGTPSTLAGYGIGDVQPLDADLTSIAALGYVSPSFLKKTAANTWALDTNTYSTTAHTHTAIFPNGGIVPACEVNNRVLSSQTDGTLAWVDQAVVSGGGGEVDLSGYATLAAPVFTTSYGFSAWRFVPSGTNLLFNYNGVTKATLGSDGTITFVGDVVAYG